VLIGDVIEHFLEIGIQRKSVSTIGVNLNLEAKEDFGQVVGLVVVRLMMSQVVVLAFTEDFQLQARLSNVLIMESSISHKRKIKEQVNLKKFQHILIAFVENHLFIMRNLEKVMKMMKTIKFIIIMEKKNALNAIIILAILRLEIRRLKMGNGHVAERNL
jgi:hypothetical protein